MTSEGKFWVAIWSIIAVSILVLSLAGIYYFQSKNRLIEDMVKNGVDPIKAACSLEIGHSQLVDCSVMGMK